MTYYIYTSKMLNQAIYLSVFINEVFFKYRIEIFDYSLWQKCLFKKRNAFHESIRSFTRDMLTLVTIETNVN